MQASVAGGKQPPMWLPPIKMEYLVALILIIIGANIDIIPQVYHTTISSPIVFLIGMLLAAGLAAVGEHPIAFAIAFCLVNLIRLMPKAVKVNPGVEGFTPSGTIDWVTTHKKWFVEKVLHERPVAIREKEVSTYPIQS